jgi:DNA-binding response OmpR family regulator
MASPITVLLIDDNAEVLGAVRPLLEGQGYRVLTAADGNQGLALAERERPDVVIVDLMMPQRSGFHVAQVLKGRDPRRPRVLMVTASDDPTHQRQALALGIDDYLRKPFSLERLLESVTRLTRAAEPSE